MSARMFWILWLAVGFFYEMYAIISRQPGDTLSEQVWALRETVGSNAFSFLMFLLAAVFAWAIYHFGFQDVE